MFPFNKLACTLGNTFSLLSRHSIFNPDSFLKITAGCIQTRDMGANTKKRRTTHAPRWWVARRRKYVEDYLTIENKQFLKEVVNEKYLDPGDTPLKDDLFQRGAWTPQSRRTGVLARKIGIYPMWTTEGKRFQTTLLQVVDNHVINYVPPEQVQETPHGYRAKGLAYLIIGAESSDPQKYRAAYNGLFTKAGVMPKRKLTKFMITPDAIVQPGTPLYASHFRVGDYVNVYGKTVDHGFQGVVNRWGFKGGRKTHGVTKSHRRGGNIGAGAGRNDNVWRGTKMPGHMGCERRTAVALQIFRINTKYNVIWVKGASVPGPVHSFVRVMDCFHAKKCHTEENPPPFPTYYPEEEEEKLAEQIYADHVHQFAAETITYEEKEQTKNAIKKK